MQVFKVLKPSKEKAILFFIILVFCSVVPIARSDFLWHDFRRVPIIAFCLVLVIDTVDNDIGRMFFSVMLYALAITELVFLIYFISCVFIELVSSIKNNIKKI